MAVGDHSPSVVTRRSFLQGVMAITLVSGLGVTVAGCQQQQAPSAAKAPSGTTIKVGALVPFSGPIAIYGNPMAHGMQTAVDKINEEGGILGNKLELVVEDSKEDPPVAVEKAKKLLTQDKVVALFGTIQSNVRDAVAPVAEQEKSILFYQAKWEGGNCSKSLFYLGPEPYQQWQEFAPWVVENFGKTFYYVANDYVFPRDYFAFLKKRVPEAGGRWIGEDYSPLGTSDWSTIITKVEAAKPDILVSGVVGGDNVAFIKQVKDFGLKAKVKLITGITFNPPEVEGMGDASEGVHIPTNYATSLDTPVNKEFLQRYKAKWGDKEFIDEISAASFTTPLLFKAGAEKAKSLDSAAVIKAIEGMSIDAPEGKIEIRAEDHQAKLPMRIMKVTNLRHQVVKEFGTLINPKPCQSYK